MKKNHVFRHCLGDVWRKTFMVMKLTSILIFLAVFSVAAEGFGQSGTISMKMEDVSLKEVFQELKLHSDYTFVYSEKSINGIRVEQLDVNDADLDVVMSECLKDTNLEYFVENNVVVIRKKVPVVIEEVKQEKKEIKGTVTDADGNTLPGVSVVIKGTTKGVSTNLDGEYSLDIEGGNVVLVFSFVGMLSQEVTYSGQEVLNIVLLADSEQMDEVVVVGYGTSKKKDLTGSVTRVSAKQLETVAVSSNMQSMLQGRAAGVNVMVSSASPTSPVSIIIRGASSLSGDAQPLWVIDGVPQYMTGTSGDVANTLYNMNLDDVQSLDILKDASATAIYGSRAANGVVLVTTKKGKAGMKPVIEVSSKLGVQTMDANDYRSLTAPEYIALSKAAVKEGYRTYGKTDYFIRKYVDRDKVKGLMTSEIDAQTLTDDVFKEDAYYDGNTNWWDLMTQDAITQQNTLSLRGGSASSSYYASFYNKNQKGIVKGGDSESYGGRFNFESSIRETIRMGLNINASTRKANNKDGMIGQIFRMRPDLAAYDEDGDINLISRYVKNPLLELENRNEAVGKNFSGTLFFDLDLTKDLRFRTSGTVDYGLSKYDTFSMKYYSGDESRRTLSNSENSIYVFENTLTYTKKIKEHDIVALAGFSLEKSTREHMKAVGEEFPDDKVLIDLGSAADKVSIESGIQSSSMVSSFARLNYKFKDKYLLTATLRADGSSRFGVDKRWGYFPSAAVAWRITKEPWMEFLSDAIPYLKLRFSVGKSGSQNLGNYDWSTLMGSSIYNGLPGITPSTIGNDALQWEKQTQMDLGLDFGLWKERIRGSLGLYKKQVDNLIYFNPVATSSSFSEVVQNVASIDNKGIEFDFTADILKTKDLKVEFNFNIAKNIPTLLKLNGADSIYGGGKNDYFRIAEGEKMGKFYGYRSAKRLFKNQEEIAALQTRDPGTGLPVPYRIKSERIGDVYIMDLDGDGEITLDDREVIGNSIPDFFGGFGSTVYWKGFKLDARFTFSVGGDRLWKDEMDKAGDINNYNRASFVLNSTTLDPNGTFPRVTYYDRGKNRIFCDKYLHDASYLKLATLNLSYRFPKAWFGNGLLQSVDITGQATNLFTITNYPGVSPDGNFSSENGAFHGVGVDYSTYPQAKTYSIGIKFTLK